LLQKDFLVILIGKNCFEMFFWKSPKLLTFAFVVFKINKLTVSHPHFKQTGLPLQF